MRNKRENYAAFTILILSVVCFLPIAGSAFALNAGPPPDQTFLEVKESGGQIQWNTLRTIHSLHAITFRWKTSAPNTSYGEWQIMDYQPQPNGMNETPFATGNVPLAPAGQFKQFTIDFAQLQQQHPDMIPANAPGTAKYYYVRMVPWTSNTTIAGSISPAVKIAYSSGSGSGSGLQVGGGGPTIVVTVTDVQVSPNQLQVPTPGMLYVSAKTSKPSSLIVRLSQSAPVLDSNHNPSFASVMVENSVHVSSFHTKHFVGLFDLKGETHYYYVIEVTDKDGNKAYKQGDFLMGKLRSLFP